MDLRQKLAICRMPPSTTHPALPSGAEAQFDEVERHRLDRRHGHLPFLRAGRPLHLAAEDPADQFLHLRLQLLHQPLVLECAPRPLHIDEVVKLTMDFYRRNYIEGLFLSSGVIRSPDETMEQMVVSRAAPAGG